MISLVVSGAGSNRYARNSVWGGHAMAREIERKFLVVNEGWREHVVSSSVFTDGLLSTDGLSKIRVRRLAASAYLTVKGPRHSFTRDEFEYEIPLADADEMLAKHCIGQLLRKTRHTVANEADHWFVDLFEGPLTGLVVAEIELSDEGQSFARPHWVGREITHDRRYGSAALLRNGIPSVAVT